MDAYKQFKVVVHQWLRYVGLFVGHDILRDDFKPNWFTALMAMIGSSLTCFILLTIWYFGGDLAVKSGGFLGSAIKIAMKSIFPLISRPRIVQSIRFLTQIYEQNQNTVENQLYFDRFVKILKMCAQFLILNYGGYTVLAIICPIILYMLTGRHELILPIYLPGMSFESTQHYGVNMIQQLIITPCSIGIYAYLDILFVIQLLHVILMTDILCHKVHAISDMAAISRRSSHVEIKLNLRNVIKLHNELRQYMEDLQKLYYYPIAIIVAVAVGSMGFKIFAVFMVEVVPLVLYVGITSELLELGYFCAAGTMVDICYDRFYNELIASNWYLLPLKEQKTLILLLNAAKESNNLNVADIMPLNARTYLVMINRIYSFTMVLHRAI